jgi:hypothetical protein
VLPYAVSRRIEALAKRRVGDLELHVRVDEEQIVERARRGAREVERGVAGRAEVDERDVVNLAWNAAGGEVRSYALARVVGRAGVADHVAGDRRGGRREAALDDSRLVPDDHVEAQSRGGARDRDAVGLAASPSSRISGVA